MNGALPVLPPTRCHTFLCTCFKIDYIYIYIYPVRWVPQVIYVRVKQPERETDRSPASGAKAKSDYSWPSSRGTSVLTLAIRVFLDGMDKEDSC